MRLADDPGADQVDDGFAIDDRPPKVERRHVTHEDRELLDIAAICADTLAKHLNLLRRGIGRQDDRGRIARRARRDEEYDHEEDQGDARLQHPTDNVLDGNLPLAW